jgi:hypothetical protein
MKAIISTVDDTYIRLGGIDQIDNWVETGRSGKSPFEIRAFLSKTIEECLPRIGTIGGCREENASPEPNVAL